MLNSKPLITIVVPIYNVEDYLQQCLDSIINQTYDYLEIILVDDGSSDNCPKICDEYAKKDNRIKVIHKQNGGLSSARNAGLDIMNGEYVAFIDSDDVIHLQYFEILLYFAQKFNAEIVQNVISSNGIIKELFNDFETIDYRILNKKEAVKNIADVFKDYVSACNKLFSSNCFKGIRFPEGRVNEDVFTVYKCFWNISNNFIELSIPLYYYTIRDQSIMHKEYSIKRLDELDGWKEAFDYFVSINENSIADSFLKRYFERLKRHWHLIYDNNLDNKNDLLKNISNRGKNVYKNVIKSNAFSFGKKIKIFIFCYCPFIRLTIIKVLKKFK